MAASVALMLALAMATQEPALREEAATLRFGNHVVELCLDRHSGAWRSFGRPDGARVLGQGAPAAGAVALKGATEWLPMEPMRLLTTRVERHGPEMVLRVLRRQGEWEVEERLALRPGLDLLSRSVTLTFRGAQPVLVDTVRLSLLGARVGPPADCSLLVPECFPPLVLPFTALRPGRSTGLSDQTTKVVALHDAAGNLGLAAACLCLTDRSFGSIVEDAETVAIHHDLRVCLMAAPGEAFTCGTQYVRLVEGGPEAPLDAAQALFRLVGHGVPTDSPPDAPSCVIYSAHAGGTIDSGFRDGGGFRQFAARIPFLAGLGFNTFWMLPFWHGPVYAPIDYGRLDETLGSEDDLRALVETAHRHGARVLGDLIPHGPRPESGLEQTHPEWIARDPAGGFRYQWGCYDCDYAHPGWQQFMAEHAADWVRRVGLDGYRVDVALGQQENWQPYPGNRPGNSCVGGIQMLPRVRAAIHREKPSAVLLAEATHPGLWAGCEMVYDFPFAYQVAPRAVEMPPDEFVPALRRWLQWQRALLPDGALPLRYVESHDTVRARLCYGPGLHRAFLGLLTTIPGVPMLYDGQESGCEPLLRALLAARRACRALTHGMADYLAVHSSVPAVCAHLRRDGESAAITAINFSGRRMAVRLSVDPARLPTAAARWRDLLGGEARVRRAGGRLHLSTHLAPYGTAILVPGKAPASPRPTARQPAVATVSAADCIEHRGAHYRLLVERRSGLLRALLAPDGTPLLSRMTLREGPRKLFLGSEPLDWSNLPPARFTEVTRGSTHTLSFAGQVGPADQPLLEYVLRYRLDHRPRVRVELHLTARRAIERMNGMLRQTLSLPAGAEWFAETLEGELRGESVARASGEWRPYGRYWHPQPWALWEECLLPLAGSFGARVPGGARLAMHDVPASQPDWRQTLALRAPARGAEEGDCQAELRWLDGKQAVSLAAGRSVTLAFTATVLAPGQAPPVTRPPAGPRLTVEGPRYTVTNAHYRATLIRSRGGALVELSPSGRASLLRDTVLYTDHGLYPPFRDFTGIERPLWCSSSDDVEGELTLQRSPGRLVITLTGALRRTAAGFPGVAQPLTRTRLRYTFDETPEVGVEVSLLPPRATDEPVFLAQRLHLVGVRRWQAGARAFTAAAADAGRAWESRRTPLRLGEGLWFAGEGSRLEVTDLVLPEGFANLFVYDGGGGNVTLFAAPNDMTPVPARRWLTFRYRLRPSAERE